MNRSTAPSQSTPARPALAIVGEFNIFTAMETKALLMDAIAAAPEDSDSEIGVELSQVTDIDSAGLQLMVMARREALRQGKRLRFMRYSESVADLVALCDMTAPFGTFASSDPTP
ncbi:STAS domain-containing protein [Acidovorax facilis]|uniref:STAS domain-containing protein n=1 Tax=Acidovorax facilis TaxID=12917 RepID=UPI003CF03A8D